MDKRVQEISNIIKDSRLNRFETYAELSGKDPHRVADEAVREGFYDILGEKTLTWRGWRNHQNEIYTIMEDVLNTNLPLGVQDTPFYREVVEMKNGALGDKNIFVVEDPSTLSVTRFAGNHWDTDRKKLLGNYDFSLDTEWIYVHVYDDFERFLIGAISLDKMLSKIEAAFANDINDRISTAFMSAGSYLPAKFIETGTFDRKGMLRLITRVQTLAHKPVILAGTRVALASVAEGALMGYLNDAQKDEMARTGNVYTLTQLGCRAVEIPQTFKTGTYDFRVDDNMILVLPENEKFIKVYFEGDTRARNLTYTDTHDQTVDIQMQTKVGAGVVFSTFFGKWILA